MSDNNQMIIGRMQNHPLLLSSILQFAETAHGRREIVSREPDGGYYRYDFKNLSRRAAQCAHFLDSLGIRPQDRVSSLALNTHRHLELLFAVPGMGAILHTANPRLSDEQIAYTIHHARARVLFLDAAFLPTLRKIEKHIPSVEKVVVLSVGNDNGELFPGLLEYEHCLSKFEDRYEWSVFDENWGAILCYTSGTTGNPKGVLYSHRSTLLHALVAGLGGAYSMSAFDCVLPVVPIYHASAWGFPFVALINGAKIVLPADKLDAMSLYELIENEGVTISGGVPTIWTAYLDFLRSEGKSSHKLDRLIVGGSAVPTRMSETFAREYQVKVQQIWGMTELNPLGVLATSTPEIAALGTKAEEEKLWSKQGRLQWGLELKIVDESGNELPRDGETSGALLARGHWTVGQYYNAEADCLDAEGWFDTGDIATLDEHGYMRIADRSKDIIKSGGEWISSIDMENVAMSFDGVRLVAVVGVTHDRWGERPVMIVEQADGCTVDPEELKKYIGRKVPKWWIPDEIYFADIPLTSVGKIDKKMLRQRFEGRLYAG